MEEIHQLRQLSATDVGAGPQWPYEQEPDAGYCTCRRFKAGTPSVRGERRKIKGHESDNQPHHASLGVPISPLDSQAQTWPASTENRLPTIVQRAECVKPLSPTGPRARSFFR